MCCGVCVCGGGGGGGGAGSGGGWNNRYVTELGSTLRFLSYIYKIKEKISLHYPFIVFGGNPCGLKNVFDSSVVNEPSGFEPQKFYCNNNNNNNNKSKGHNFAGTW